MGVRISPETPTCLSSSDRPECHLAMVEAVGSNPTWDSSVRMGNTEPLPTSIPLTAIHTGELVAEGPRRIQRDQCPGGLSGRQPGAGPSTTAHPTTCSCLLVRPRKPGSQLGNVGSNPARSTTMTITEEQRRDLAAKLHGLFCHADHTEG